MKQHRRLTLGSCGFADGNYWGLGGGLIPTPILMGVDMPGGK